MTMFSDGMLLGIDPAFASAFRNFATLFGGGADGLMIDLTDQTTLFQNANGSEPVVSNGDPIGLALDQHKWGGLTLAAYLAAQAELMTNGTFATGTTGWSLNFGSALNWDSVNQRLSLVNGGGSATAVGPVVTTVVGRWYAVSADVFNAAPGSSVVLRIGTTSAGSELGNPAVATGTNLRFFKATTTTTYISPTDNSGMSRTTQWDNISVKELDGHHATQSGSARPTWASATGDVAFNGTSQYLITDYLTPQGNNFMSAYHRIGAAGSDRQMMGSFNNGASRRAILAMRSDNKSYAYFGAAVSLVGVTPIASTIGTLFGDRGNVNSELFVNGILDATVATAGSMPDTIPFYIGASNSSVVGAENFTNGGLKRVVVLAARAQDTMSAADIHANLIS